MVPLADIAREASDAGKHALSMILTLLMTLWVVHVPTVSTVVKASDVL